MTAIHSPTTSAVPEPVTAERAPVALHLGRAFAALMRDTLHISESDAPYRAFSTPWCAELPLEPDLFRDRLHFSPRVVPARRDPAAWFAFVCEPQPGEPMPQERYRAQTFSALRDAMSVTLEELCWLDLPQVRNSAKVHSFLVGRAPDGDLAGLRTINIWT